MIGATVTHVDNAYNIPNITIMARACRTNLASNTAFRGFGRPQGMMVMEQIMSRVANHLDLPQDEIREMNMYSDGDLTPHDAVLSNCTIRRCWSQLKETSSFTSRKESVKKFNE